MTTTTHTPQIGEEVWIGDRRMTVTQSQPGFYIARDKDSYYYALGFDGGKRHLDEQAAMDEARRAIAEARK